jgi:transposase
MEACGGAHYWARKFRDQGHEVELLPAFEVRKRVFGNKDDAVDATAIWLSAQDPRIRRVAVKTVEQQAELTVHRIRTQLVSERTARVNALRGLLYEFCVAMPKGREIGLRWLGQHRAQVDAQLPERMQRLLNLQLETLGQLDEHIQALEAEIKEMVNANPLAKRLMKVSGIGVLGASALASTLGDGSAWRNARQFACCLGLVPSHTGTGGKVRMGRISRRGDAYLRTLLIHGARSVVRLARPSQWIAEMLERRPFNVVVTALAHKLARVAWALAAHARTYDPAWQSEPPRTATSSAAMP